MGTPQEWKLSTAYKTVRRKFCQSILRWSADDYVKEEVSIFNYKAHLDTLNILYLNLSCGQRDKIFPKNIINKAQGLTWTVLHKVALILGT
jgi:hypothetical protein